MNYFKKEVMQSRVMFSNGSYFNGWQRVADDEGILATQDPRITAELDALIRQHVGGVSRITSEEFLGLQSKKNEPSRTHWREELRTPNMPLEQKLSRDRLLAHAEPVAAEAPKPKVAAPPASAEFRPKTSRA